VSKAELVNGLNT